MSSKRELSTSPSSEQTDGDTTDTQPKNSPRSTLCLICGDNARIINYGALSCQSCKTFFRRNGFRPETVRPCIFDRNCEVNMYTRHNCTACRLAKCFKMGMTSDLIRKEDHKKAKTSSSTKSDNTEQATSQQTASSLTTSDFVQNGQPFLSDSEWTLLSNILYAYDIYTIVPQIRHTIENLPESSVENNVNEINPLEMISQIFTSIQSFINALPDFRILTIHEQTSLFERNLYGVIGFYFISFSRNTKILHNIKFMEAFTNIYGSELVLLAKTTSDELDPDSTLIKLMLIVLVFSSHCFILDNQKKTEHDCLLHGTFRLLGSQNVYLELLWKYMIHRYGYYEAMHRFSRLINTVLCVLKKSAAIYQNNQAHQNMVHNIIQKIKQSLTTNTNEQTPLWGKT